MNPTIEAYEADLAHLLGWLDLELDKALRELDHAECWQRRHDLRMEAKAFEDVLRSFYGLET